MTDAIQILHHTLRDIWDDLWTAAVCNLLWLIFIVLLIPGPPATIALFYVGNRLAHGEVTGLEDFWWAFKRYWGVSWRWGLANAAIITLLSGDFFLTGQLSRSGAARFWQGFYIALLGIWLLLQLYAIPFLIEQETASVRMALRNGAIMLGRNPGFSLALGLSLVCLLAIGTLLFMFSGAVGGILLAAAGNHAVLKRLEVEMASKEGSEGRK